MKNRKPYRPPWVLEIGEPVGGDTPEARDARRKFHDLKPHPLLHDQQLDAMMRGMWNDKEYWRDHGLKPPVRPYPGLAAIRATTYVR